MSTNHPTTHAKETHPMTNCTWTVQASTGVDSLAEHHADWFSASASARKLAHEAMPSNGRIRWSAEKSPYSFYPDATYTPLDQHGEPVAVVTVTANRPPRPTRTMYRRPRWRLELTVGAGQNVLVASFAHETDEAAMEASRLLFHEFRPEDGFCGFPTKPFEGFVVTDQDDHRVASVRVCRSRQRSGEEAAR